MLYQIELQARDNHTVASLTWDYKTRFAVSINPAVAVGGRMMGMIYTELAHCDICGCNAPIAYTIQVGSEPPKFYVEIGLLMAIHNKWRSKQLDAKEARLIAAAGAN